MKFYRKVHLSGRDIGNAIYSKVYGIDTGETKEQEIKPVMCPRCKGNYGPTSEYCYRCGMPLKEEKIYMMERNSIELRKEFLDAAKEGLERLERLSGFLELLEIVDSDPRLRRGSWRRRRKDRAKSNDELLIRQFYIFFIVN